MNINLKLSDTSIDYAIGKLKDVLEVIENGIGDIVDILVTDGEMVANQAYGGMAIAWGHRDESTADGVAKGHIGVTAKTPDAAIIAEFGAGYSTMEYHPMAQALESKTGIKVEVGSYSRENDGQYPSRRRILDIRMDIRCKRKDGQTQFL